MLLAGRITLKQSTTWLILIPFLIRTWPSHSPTSSCTHRALVPPTNSFLW